MPVLVDHRFVEGVQLQSLCPSSEVEVPLSGVQPLHQVVSELGDWEQVHLHLWKAWVLQEQVEARVEQVVVISGFRNCFLYLREIEDSLEDSSRVTSQSILEN